MYAPGMPMAPAPQEDIVATVGEPMADGVEPASDEAITEALKTVYDPEIPVNIYDLGLIYDVKREETGDVFITMTVTAPACPVAGELPIQVGEAVARLDGVGRVTVELVWDPPWTPDKMSEDAKIMLDMF